MKNTEKINQCRQILYDYDLNQLITTPSDFEFLISVFEGHTEWEQKKGCGIENISVMVTPYKTRAFQIIRTDGTKTDISFMHSIKNRSKLVDIKMACRAAIRSEIVKFKTFVNYGIDVCPFTGEVLTKVNTHIDHYDLTFNEIVDFWLLLNDINELHKQICATVDNEFITYFTNPIISEDFRIFHNRNTHLRAISKTANLSILKRK